MHNDRWEQTLKHWFVCACVQMTRTRCDVRGVLFALGRYLMECRWYEQWKEFVETGDQNSSSFPGQIDNTALFEGKFSPSRSPPSPRPPLFLLHQHHLLFLLLFFFCLFLSSMDETDVPLALLVFQICNRST